MKEQWWVGPFFAGITLLPAVVVPLLIFAYWRTSPKRLFWLRLVAVVISSTFAYTLAEVAFRVYRYGQVRQEFMADMLKHSVGQDKVLNMPWDNLGGKHQVLAHQAAVFDRDIGFRLRPNFKYEDTPPNLPTRKWRTNSLGHISDDEYPVEKPPGEFRIITIGDSFTDGYANSIRWQAVLQERLNGNAAWRKFVGEKCTRVLNLGMNGIGIGQFRAVFDFEGQRFQPDIVVLNFITNDIARRWYAKGHIKTPEDVERHFRANVVENESWYSFYPELLASTKAGEALGLRGHLQLQKLARWYGSWEEGARVSADAVAHIVQRQPRTLLTHHPVYEELASNQIPDEVKPFEAALGDVKICYMYRFLSQLKSDNSSYPQWYQLPNDLHPSDLGQKIYAEAMEMALIERFAGHP